MTSASANVLNALHEALPKTPMHDRVTAGEIGFRTWNTLHKASPLVRVECSLAAEVQTVVQIAQSFGTLVAVAGGHCDVRGRNNIDGAVIIDLQRMNQVFFDGEKNTVTVGGGTTIAELLHGLPAGRVSVTGANGAVGVVGLSVCGGYGTLNSRFGLASDTIQGAEMVLADGTLVAVNETEQRDLFWALRGGGSGFGVVTRLTLRSFNLPKVLSATVNVPLQHAHEALLLLQASIDNEPDSLNIIPLFMMNTEGVPSLFLALVWTGENTTGERMLDAFCSLPSAQVMKRGWVPYYQTLDPEDLWPRGRWSGETYTFSHIDENLAERLVEVARAIPAPGCTLFLQGFHGAPTRVAPGATAFPLRSPHFISAVGAS